MEAADRLAVTFLDERATPSLPTSSLGARLEAAVSAGRSKWPVEVTPEVFARYLAARIDNFADLDVALASPYLADLYLCCACANGVRGAVEAFDGHFRRQVGAFISRIGNEPDFVDEVAQRLHVKLLVGSDDAPPRIAQYSGRGSLVSWTCAAAIRIAIDLRRVPAGDELDDDLGELAAGADQERELLREQYGDELKVATAESLATLSPRDRNLLRFYHLERLTLDKLAAMHRVHPTTVMRWLATAREQILDETRRLLRGRLGISDSEFSAVVALLHSDLDLSVHRLLNA